jgi:protein-tyrosine phosphatase
MSPQIYWMKGLWPGNLALGARPRGGDWLDDEIKGWHREGVDEVLSLLTRDEEQDLDLTNEAKVASNEGIKFLSFPFPDRQVPGSRAALTSILEKVDADLSTGKNVLIHCRQGIGRTGLVAACLLVSKGWDPASAIERISFLRGMPVPETDEQRRWIDGYAAVLAGK